MTFKEQVTDLAAAAKAVIAGSARGDEAKAVAEGYLELVHVLAADDPLRRALADLGAMRATLTAAQRLATEERDARMAAERKFDGFRGLAGNLGALLAQARIESVRGDRQGLIDNLLRMAAQVAEAPAWPSAPGGQPQNGPVAAPGGPVAGLADPATGVGASEAPPGPCGGKRPPVAPRQVWRSETGQRAEVVSVHGLFARTSTCDIALDDSGRPVSRGWTYVGSVPEVAHG